MVTVGDVNGKAPQARADGLGRRGQPAVELMNGFRARTSPFPGAETLVLPAGYSFGRGSGSNGDAALAFRSAACAGHIDRHPEGQGSEVLN